VRILILPSAYPSGDNDFAGAFIRDQAAVIAMRHEVTVAAPLLLSLKAILTGRTATRSTTNSAVPSTGIKRPSVLTIRIPNLTNRWERLTYALWRQCMSRALFKRFDADPPDLIHAHFVRPAGTVAARLSKRWERPTLLTEHSGPFKVQLRTNWIRRETTSTLHSVDQVLAVSPALRDSIISEIPDIRPLVLGNVLDDSFFVPPSERKSTGIFRFLFVGRLVPIKGLDVLLLAAAELKAREPKNWRLDIAGDGPLRVALGRTITELGLESHVAFLGSLDRRGVLRQMQLSDVFVLPSRAETFGVVLIEAMGCGVPVIACSCGGPSWVVDSDSGVLVPPEDSHRLQEAMFDLLTRRIELSAGQVRASAVRRFGRTTWLDQYDLTIRKLVDATSRSDSVPS